MDSPRPPVLNTMQVDPLVHLNRAHAAVYSCAILALLYHRALSILTSQTFLSFALFLSLAVADLVLAFMWVVTQAFRWRPVRWREFPGRLESAVGRDDWPALDVFICTADPHKEPPMGAVNTALSVMAFDYPTHKLSVYLSDDGGSQVTLFAFVEAARFARYWLPFCREHGLVDRSPEAYFSSCGTGGGDHSEKLQILYQRMKERVESALEMGSISEDLVTSKEELKLFKEWTIDFTREEHQTIIQVLLESSRETDIASHPLPNLIYVSREKKKKSQHHFKAGALNVLIRVSGIMTNAPVILTLDCDMYSNDPQTPWRALCHLLDNDKATRLAYVQFPQHFKGINEHDIYASELKRLFQIQPIGMNGFQGTSYVGSGSFFYRRCFYSSPPLSSSALDTTKFIESLKISSSNSLSSEAILKSAHQVASCSYEHGTRWGHMMGMRYGSLVEDYNTGYRLHCDGWETIFCDPERPAFLGDVPITLHEVFNQNKRWCVGLLEVAFSKYCPLSFGSRKASLPMAMCYAHYAFWGIWCIPISIYAIVPQMTLTYQVPLFPKAFDPWCYLYIYLFLAAYIQDLVDFLRAKGTIRQWWNDQRMWMIRGVTSYLFGVSEFLLQHIGISTIGFNVTNKVMDDEQRKLYNEGTFNFGVESPFLVSLCTFAIINFTSFTIGLVKSLRQRNIEDVLMQIIISGFVMINCWPIYKAMAWRRDGGRVPLKVMKTSFILAGAIYSIAHLIF